MLKAFRLAVKSLFANPIRTGLTTLGIVIGIGTVVLVLSAGEGFRSLINDQIEAYGSNTIFVETRVPPTTRARSGNAAANSDSSRATSAVAITTLKYRDVEDIKRLPNIRNAYGAVFGLKVATYGQTSKNATVFGASAARFDIDRNKLEAGRFYTQQEDNSAAQVVILGKDLADDLFGLTPPVGRTVRVGDLNFEVVGVYERKGSFGGMNEDQSVFVPLNTAQKKLLGIDYLTFVVAEAKDAGLASATAEDIRTVVRKNHGISDPDKDDFFVQTMEQGMETFNTIFNGLTFLLIAIAAISLVVGGVGIMNIMYVVVTERTSEIGLKKALGARNDDVLSEFLIEAVLVTLIGGVFGVAMGSLLSFFVAVIAQYSGLVWEFKVPFYAVAVGLGVSGTIGILFGVFPARAASRLDPVEAMRHE